MALCVFPQAGCLCADVHRIIGSDKRSHPVERIPTTGAARQVESVGAEMRFLSLSAALGLVLALASPPSEAAPAAQWTIDPARTHISFSIDAVGYPRTDGEFRRFTGTILVDFDHPERSHVRFEVEVRSVDVGSPAFNDYLTGDALLDAARFPEVSFTSTTVEKLDDSTVKVTGDLSMLGQTRPLSVDVHVERQPGLPKARLGFKARATIDRLRYGMNTGFPLISRDIDLSVSSEAVEK